MMITIRCPECGESSSIATDEAGLKAVCRCGADLDSSSLDTSFPGPPGSSALDPSSTGENPAATGERSVYGTSGFGTETSRTLRPKKRRRPTPAVVPERIDRYQIGPVIGRGSFGTVYLARDEKLNRPVALKVAHLDVLRNPDLIERFKKEALVAANLKHEGIVFVHDVDFWESWLYIATEYIEGRNLRDHLKEGPIALDMAVRTTIALAQSLSYAHAAGVTHRDLKPTNVMITLEGKVKLIDFGLVHIDASTQTREHSFLGTLNYMSPEQASGDARKVSYASDQYSLGVVFYEMLCGQPPYRGEAYDVLTQLLSPQPVDPPSLLNPTIPVELEEICLKALSKPVEGRFKNCRALAEALTRWLDAYERTTGESARPGEAPAEPVASPAPAVLLDPTDDPFSLRQRDAHQRLVALAAERAEAEERAASTRAMKLERIQQHAEKQRTTAKTRFETEKAALIESEERRQRQRQVVVDQDMKAAEAIYVERCERIQQQAESYIAERAKKCEWEIAIATGVFQRRVEHARHRARSAARAARRIHTALTERANRLGGRHEPSASGSPRTEIFAIRPGLRSVAARLDRLESLKTPGLMRRPVRLGLDLLVLALVLAPASIVFWRWLGPFALAPAALLAATVALYFDRVALRRAIRLQDEQLGVALQEIRGDLNTIDGMIIGQAGGRDDSLTRWIGKIEERYKETVRHAEWKRKQLLKGTERWRAERLELASQRFRARRDKIQKSAGGNWKGRLQTLERRYRQQRLAIDRSARAAEKAVEVEHREARWRIREQWASGLAGIAASVGALKAAVERANPAWDAAEWSAWDPPRTTPAVVPFGAVRVPLAAIPNGMPRDAALHEGQPTELHWPALLDFPERANVLIEAPQSERVAAIGALQTAALRLVTNLPPGRVRLTIIDPQGLGGSFDAFLQLADFETVVPPVITEADKIDQCLLDHLGHIKKMISYLRNDHPTIREFNDLAGEVAEPYRILIVADFPAGFTVEAAGRLARIAAQGPRCGVLTLLACSSDKPLPSELNLAEFAASGIRLTYSKGRFVWNDPDFGGFPLTIDPPPPAQLATAVLRRVGAAAERARRVEVPFEFVAPPADQWWTGRSATGLEVGIGRMGTTKVQELVLGKGTAQHVLIAGRTGSGKSSLLHALIVNLALKYGPDELELALVDFKKGVEFKTYASHALPHARVIAVESEREFGVSVLRRLDEELNARGERFRQAGVPDLPAYRAIEGLPPLPRIVLVVDEFQEFFTEDDAIAHEASQFLDRLMRQGRAFGVHVVLGSQTLSGAYSLARSTLSQMGVRIALQCGAADSHLILGEDNNAPRLLSRPGEAVYNDVNGLPEGNHFFQVVWLAEERRESYLAALADLARQRHWKPLDEPVVFEGNEEASIARNAALCGRLAAPAWPEADGTVRAWLGEPIAIKSPTAALFRRRAGDNLLIVGQDASAATGMIVASLIGVAAQLPPDGPTSASFVVLDGTVETAVPGAPLAPVFEILPHAREYGGRLDARPFLEHLAAELERRLANPDEGDPRLFLVIHGLSAFRELRRTESYDYSEAAREAARPAAALSNLLRSGPAVGIHVVAWCDTLSNLNRTIDRHDQREFGAKVAFQMSAADSSYFLDSHLAARLGPRRALYFDDELGAAEKFRPYGLPQGGWLAWVRERFLARLETLEAEGEAEIEAEPESEATPASAIEPSEGDNDPCA